MMHWIYSEKSYNPKLCKYNPQSTHKFCYGKNMVTEDVFKT